MLTDREASSPAKTVVPCRSAQRQNNQMLVLKMMLRFDLTITHAQDFPFCDRYIIAEAYV